MSVSACGKIRQEHTTFLREQGVCPTGERLEQLHKRLFQDLHQLAGNLNSFPNASSVKVAQLIKHTFGLPVYYFDAIAEERKRRGLKDFSEYYVESMMDSVLEKIWEIDNRLDQLVREFFSKEGPFLDDVEEEWKPVYRSFELPRSIDFVLVRAEDFIGECKKRCGENEDLSEFRKRLTNGGKWQWTTKKMMYETLSLNDPEVLVCRERIREWFQKIPICMRLEMLRRLFDPKELDIKRLFPKLSLIKYFESQYVLLCSVFALPSVRWLFGHDEKQYFNHSGALDLFFDLLKAHCMEVTRYDAICARVPFGFVYHSLDVLRETPGGQKLLSEWLCRGLTRSLLEKTCEFALTEEVATITADRRDYPRFVDERQGRISLNERRHGAEEILIVRGAASLGTWDIVHRFYRSLDLHKVRQSQLGVSLGAELLALLWEEMFMIGGELEPGELNFASQIENFVESVGGVYRLKDPVNVEWFDTLIKWVESTRPELTERFVKALFTYLSIASPSVSLDPKENPRIASLYPLLSDEMKRFISGLYGADFSLSYERELFAEGNAS